MKFGSVCSGIEAASVAWKSLGWRAAWLAEIEKFPSQVLAHHYPDVPNLGDMTRLPEEIRAGRVDAPDVFCGGTPCQAFSVAGLRRSLDDARGNLSLVFCEIANEIDDARFLNGEEPCIVFWENVPGVLSTADNAFGCFLAGLAGEDDPLVAPGGKWANAGCVFGPKRTVAWRVLDAQYFGVAQRRRRVFVVASARARFNPAAVLFEFDGVRRDSAPSREAGQEAARGAARSVALRGREGGATAELGDEVQNCLRASGGGGDKAHVLVQVALETTHTLRGEGFDASEDGTERGTPLIPVLPFDTTQITSVGNYSNPKAGDRPPGTDVDTADSLILQPVHCRDVAQTITSNYGKQVDNSDTALGPNVVAYSTKLQNTKSNGAGKIYSEYTAGLDRNSPPPALLTATQVRRLTPRECERLQGFPDNYTDVLAKQPDGPRYKALGNSWAVPVVAWIGKRIDNEVFLCEI